MKKRLISVLLILALCLSLLPAAFAEDSAEPAEEEDVPLIEFVEPDTEEEKAEEAEPAGPDALGGPEDETTPEDPELLPSADEINASGGTCGANLNWTLDDSGKLTITGSGPMNDYELEGSPWFASVGSIKSLVVGNGVTTIGKAAFGYCHNMKSVTLPNTLKRIEDRAFYGSGITSVTIPNGVSYIGSYGFGFCHELPSVTIPAGVTTILDGAFSGGTSMETIYVDSANPSFKSEDGVLFSKDGSVLCCFPSGKSGSSYTVPEGVTTIASDAFRLCLLPEVKLPGSVTVIRDYAFTYSDLTGITIPGGVKEIGLCAFNSCYKMSAITVDSNNTAYKSVDGVLLTKDGKLLHSFPGGKTGSYTIPGSVTVIGEEAFEACLGLTAVTIPGGVQRIGDFAFAFCDSLKNVTFQGPAPVIEDYSFYIVNATVRYPSNYASWTADKRQNYGGTLTWQAYNPGNKCGENLSWSLKNGTLTISGSGDMWNFRWDPGTNTTTAPWASQSANIKSVVLQKGVTSVGDEAFDRCENLTSVKFGETVRHLGLYSFQYTGLTSVTLPASVEELDNSVFYLCRKLQEIKVEAANTAFCDVDGVLFTKDKTVLLLYPAAKTGAYQIPDGVKTVAACAFSWCEGLSSLSIPNSLTRIEAFAFQNCTALEKLIIPGSVKEIGEYAFSACEKLANVRFSGSAPSFGDDCFNGVVATVLYPADDASWTPAVRQNYGGELTWVAQEPLAAPALTEAFNSATGVRVSWKPVEGAVKYQLLRKNLTKNETEWTVVGETTEQTLIDKTVASASRYTFTVRGVEEDGTLGAFDETGRTCTYISKADITDITVTADGVSLKWSKPAGAKNFRVMRRVDGVAKWTVLDVVLGTEYLDTTAEKGVKYWYTVRGVSMDNTVLINSYNGTGWSMKPLETPVLTEAFNSATGVRVSWKPNDGAVKYRLLRKNITKNETEWSTIAETTELTFIDTSAASASRYTYTVECVDSNGRICSAQGNPRTCTYIAMAKITAIGGVSNGVKLVWSQPAGAKNFRVFRKVDGEENWQILTDVQGTSYVDTTAEKGVKYWYTVRAITLAGDMYINSYNSYGWSVTRK
ncbi:MAG: leucine-rich repeat protein [Oscillospiraceae bacterium]|nr:leucine-rich repeat protein [Oscillospiraceae bacterium]